MVPRSCAAKCRSFARRFLRSSDSAHTEPPLPLLMLYAVFRNNASEPHGSGYSPIPVGSTLTTPAQCL